VLRLAFTLLALVLLALVAADAALGQAGGGSSDFGGGGGGDDFGGGGGGGDDFGNESGGGGEEVGGRTMVFILLGIAVVFVLALARRRGLLARVVSTVRDHLSRPLSAARRRDRRERVRQVELAAAEAAEADDRFAPERMHEAAEKLFRDVQRAWDARDAETLAALLGPDLLREWEHRLADFERKGWQSRVEVLDEPRIDYVGLTNREEDADDRAVVLIEATVRAYVTDRKGDKIYRKGEPDDTIELCEYWTLGMRNGLWILLSIEQREEGEHHLDAPIAASPWSDTERLRDEALMETASAGKLSAGFRAADVADFDFDGDARAAALDLSLADSRFAPDVLEAAARRAVEAWAEAVDGDDAALAGLTSEEAARRLLYGDDRSQASRLVIRGPRVRRIAIVALDVATEPATMTIEVKVGGLRYVEDRATAELLSGSDERWVTFTECWTLALDGSEAHPWRIVGVGQGADRAPASPT